MRTIHLDVVLIMIRFTCPALNSCANRFSGRLTNQFSNFAPNLNIHFEYLYICVLIICTLLCNLSLVSVNVAVL